MWIVWLVFWLVFSVWVLIGLIGWFLDWLTWNNGICKTNGLPWEVRDRDSQGGYLLRAGTEYTWLNGYITPRSNEEDR